MSMYEIAFGVAFFYVTVFLILLPVKPLICHKKREEYSARVCADQLHLYLHTHAHTQTSLLSGIVLGLQTHINTGVQSRSTDSVNESLVS